MLISQGHIKAWDYTYSFFKIATKTATDAKIQEQKAITISLVNAVGLIFSKDKKAIENFLKDKN